MAQSDNKHGNDWLIYIVLQVEDVVSRAADGTSAVQDVDFSSLRSQLGPLSAVSVALPTSHNFCLFLILEILIFFFLCQILLCIDVAATSAKSAKMSEQLLDQAIIYI